MAPLGPPTGRSGEMGDPILAEVKVIRDSTDKINRSIGEIETLVDKHLMAVDHSPRRVEQLDMMFAAAAAENGTVLERIRTLMSQIPAEHRLAGQVITRKTALTEAVSRLRACENKYRMGIEAQMAKQIKIACPEMDDRQVRQIVENGGTENVMQMAMNSQRNARANSALSNVRSRNQEIKKIERQVEELAALFMQLDEMVFQQEAFVQKAEQHTEEANDNLDKGNVEMNVAVQSARGTRKKKWICLGICGKKPLDSLLGPWMKSELIIFCSGYSRRHHHHRSGLHLCHQRHYRQQVQQARARGYHWHTRVKRHLTRQTI